MKRVLLYDIAAEKTGAAAVLNQYYEKYAHDNNVYSFFVTSILNFKENDHTKIITLPWTKRSYFHRVYCDKIFIHKLIKKYNIDEVINLQNIAIAGLKVPQTLYMHNAIPISDVNFKFNKERSLWIFKQVISKVIIHNLKYADKIIVQAEWIKQELHKRNNVPLSRICVEKMTPSFVGNNDRIHTRHAVFFYPANLCSYKNHKCIIEACKKLKNQGINDYEVVFTINPETDGPDAKNMLNYKDLPIKMIGLIDSAKMEEYYRKSILLFPSFLETVGLPLIEAQAFNAEIIVSDLPYAREAIGSYQKVHWFIYNDPDELSNCMKERIVEAACFKQGE